MNFEFVSVDDVAPVVVCLDDITNTIGLNIGGAQVNWIEPTATDNSGVVSLSSRTRAPGSFFVVGSTDVTYVFVDGSGNTATCTFAVSVVEGKLKMLRLVNYYIIVKFIEAMIARSLLS